MFTLLATFGATTYASNNSSVLEKISSPERIATLTTIIRNSGVECDEITRTFLQGYDKDGAAYWSSSCSNGRSYIVQVQSDPYAISRVIDCAVMKIRGYECFRKFGSK
jgi:hypothetical protein